MPKNKNEDIFFYTNKTFHHLAKSWCGPLFIKGSVKETLENCDSLWDNENIVDLNTPQNQWIRIKKGPIRNGFIQEQCSILKQIPMEAVATTYLVNKPNTHGAVKIYDRRNPDVCALIDFRPANRGELRGEKIQNLLQEGIDGSANKTVYHFLTEQLKDHNNPTLAAPLYSINQALKRYNSKIDKRAEKILFQTIDALFNQSDTKFDYDTKNTQSSERKLDEKYPLFLAALDKQNIKHLKTSIRSENFQKERYAKERAKAISLLIKYRGKLYSETNTQKGFQIADPIKSRKCHFTEQFITELYSRSPTQKTFKYYVKDCKKAAEKSLSREEKVSLKETKSNLKTATEELARAKSEQASEQTISSKENCIKELNYKILKEKTALNSAKKNAHSWKAGIFGIYGLFSRLNGLVNGIENMKTKKESPQFKI